MTIPDLGSDLLSVALRTAIVYVCLVVGFRIAGKREAGQLSTIDLVVLLVIANAVQNAMVGENTSLVGGLLAAAVILGLDRAIHWVAERWSPLGDILLGDPTLLVEHGRILEDAMREEGITRRELAVALRQNQQMTADEAEFVYLETNGQISVIPWRDQRAGDETADDDRAAEQVGQGSRGPGRPRRRRRLGRFPG